MLPNTDGSYEGGATLLEDGAFSGSKGVSFDAAAEYVEIPYHANIGFTAEFSVELWVKLTAATCTNNTKIIGKGYYSASNSWTINCDSSEKSY